MFGIGLTLAVLIDAFVIRGTLVPAFMRLAGEWNWWAPAPLRRFHDRFGISETVDLTDDDDLPTARVPVGSGRSGGARRARRSTRRDALRGRRRPRRRPGARSW